MGGVGHARARVRLTGGTRLGPQLLLCTWGHSHWGWGDRAWDVEISMDPSTGSIRFGIQPLYLFSSISAFIFFSHADTSSGAHQAENPFIVLLLLKFNEGNPDLVPAQPVT